MGIYLDKLMNSSGLTSALAYWFFTGKGGIIPKLPNFSS